MSMYLKPGKISVITRCLKCIFSILTIWWVERKTHSVQHILSKYSAIVVLSHSSAFGASHGLARGIQQMSEHIIHISLVQYLKGYVRAWVKFNITGQTFSVDTQCHNKYMFICFHINILKYLLGPPQGEPFQFCTGFCSLSR